MSPISWQLFAVLLWGAGYAHNRFHWDDKFIRAPYLLQLVCGLPRIGLADQLLTLEGAYLQVVGLMFLLVSLFKGRIPINDLAAICVCFLLGFIAMLILHSRS